MLANDQIVKILNDPRGLVVLILLSIWTLAWKGVALWKAAENKSKIWFVILLIINDLGILSIIYIFYFSKPKVKKPEEIKS